MMQSGDVLGVEIARVSDSGRLPDIDVTASQTASETTCSSSTTNSDGSQPCSAPGSAGSAIIVASFSGTAMRSA